MKIPAGGGNALAVTTSPLTLSNPTGVAINGGGNLYISDSGNNRIVEVSASGVAGVVTLNTSVITFDNPQSLFMDGSGNLFVNDLGNNRIVELTPAYSAYTNDNTLANAGAFVVSTGNLSLGSGSSFPYNVSTSAAVDTSEALYIADDANNRVIKVDRFGKASPVDFSSLSQTLITPHSITLDPMGNLYVLDNGGGSGKGRIIQQFTTGSNSTMAFSGTSLGFISNQIAVDNYGNVLVADLPQNGGRLVQINVGESAISFPSTPMASASSALASTVTNLGDLPLTFSANPAYTPSFSHDAGDSDACTTATSLTVGMTCNVSIQFTPQATGSLSANIAVTDNTQNVAASTQLIAVSGTATPAISTPPPPVYNPPAYNPPTSSMSLTSSDSSVAVGQSVSITAVLVATGNLAGSASPSGTVQFLDGSNGLGSVTLTAGKAVFTTSTLSVGMHRIAAVYSGNATFLSNQASIVVTVTATMTPPTMPTITLQNAAGNAFTNFAANEITSLYGITGLTGDMTATNPSTSLGGVTVTITDNAGTARQALLFGVYASLEQINLLIPSGMAPGTATISVAVPGGGTTSATVNIAGTAPGIFTTSANGQGVYAGQVIYQHSDGSQTIASPADPISLATGNQVFLALYVTGLRSASSVTATANGATVPVAWFGPQGGNNSWGLDQINLGQLPASLTGAGTVHLVVSVDGQPANTVTFSVP